MIDFGPRSTPPGRLTTGAALARLAGAYRTMPQSKLLGRLPDGRSRALAGYELAGEIARATQGIEERFSAAPPRWRELPYAGEFVVGDQLLVLGNDLSAACAGLERAGEPVWSAPTERIGADQVIARLDERIRALG